MDELIVPVSQSGCPADVRGEDVPDCGSLDIAREASPWHNGQYAPEIADGTAFCTSTDRMRVLMVTAVDLATGAVKWETPTGGSWIEVSPVPVGGTVIAAADEGSVYCLRQSDGEILWLLERTPSQHESISSLAVSGSCVILGTWDGDISCLDAVTGRHRWTVGHTDKQDSLNANIIVWHDTIICCFTAALLCLDLGTGKERWHLDAYAGNGPIDDHMNPLLVDDLLFIPLCSGGICALDLATRQILWRGMVDSMARTLVALGGILYYRDDGNGILYGTPLRPSSASFLKPFFALQFGRSETYEHPDLTAHGGRLYCPADQWLYVLEPSLVEEGMPTEYHVRKYSAPDPFATGLAHDGDLFCAGMTTHKLLIGQLPDASPLDKSHSR
jgi:hypothetical protein